MTRARIASTAMTTAPTPTGRRGGPADRGRRAGSRREAPGREECRCGDRGRATTAAPGAVAPSSPSSPSAGSTRRTGSSAADPDEVGVSQAGVSAGSPRSSVGSASGAGPGPRPVPRRQLDGRGVEQGTGGRPGCGRRRPARTGRDGGPRPHPRRRHAGDPSEQRLVLPGHDERAPHHDQPRLRGHGGGHAQLAVHERREQRDPGAAAGEPHAVEVLRAGAGVGERLGEQVDDPPQRRAQDLGELAPREPRGREPSGQRHRGLLGVGELLLRGAHVVEQHLTMAPVAEGRGGDDLADPVGVAPRSQNITRRVLGGRLVRERRQQVTQQQLVGVVAPEAVVPSPREQPGPTAAPGLGREHGRVGSARPEVEHRDRSGTSLPRAHPRGVRGGRDGLREQGELGGEPGARPPQHLAAPRVPAGRVGEDEVARPLASQQRARPLERRRRGRRPTPPRSRPPGCRAGGRGRRRRRRGVGS